MVDQGHWDTTVTLVYSAVCFFSRTEVTRTKIEQTGKLKKEREGLVWKSSVGVNIHRVGGLLGRLL